MPRKPTPIAMAEPAPDYRSFSHAPRAERPQAQRAPRQVGRLPDPIPTSPILPVDRVGREPVTLPYMRQPREIPTITPVYQELFGKQPKGLLCDPTPLYPGPWSSCDQGGGGNIHSLLLHPTCANAFFVGPDNGTMARGIHRSTGGAYFENFQKGIPEWDVYAMAMSPTGTDDQLYCVCGSLTPPTNGKGVQRLFRFNPARKMWVNLPLGQWKLPGSNVGSATFTPSLLHVVHLGGGRHVLIAVTASPSPPLPIVFEGGKGATGGTIATTLATLRAPTVCVGALGTAFDSVAWYGRPYRFVPAPSDQPGSYPWKVTKDTTVPHTEHGSGVGSLWVAPQADDSSITAYLTVAFDVPGTQLRYTELVECRIALRSARAVEPVESIDFRVVARSHSAGPPYTGSEYDTVLDLSESYQTWAGLGPGTGPAPFEMVQVAGLRPKHAARLWVTTSVSAANTPFEGFPRVVSLECKPGARATIDWDDPRNLSIASLAASGNAHAEDFLASTLTRMTWCRSSETQRVYVAPGAAGGPSIGLWRWDDIERSWERLTFYYGWQRYTGRAHYEITRQSGSLDSSWLSTWFEQFKSAYEAGGLGEKADEVLAHPEKCPKILMAVGTDTNWPQSAVRTPYGRPVPDVSVFFDVLDASGNAVVLTYDSDANGGEKTSFTATSCTYDEGQATVPRIVAKAGTRSGDSTGTNAMPIGELDALGLRWVLVPIPIGAIWMEAIAAGPTTSPPSSLRVELRVRSNTAYASTIHRIRMLPLLPKPDEPLGDAFGSLPPPWLWNKDDLLVFTPIAPPDSPFKATELTVLSYEPDNVFIAIDTGAGQAGAVASVNVDQVATWDYRRSSATGFFNALAVAPHPVVPGTDRILYAMQGDSCLYQSWDDGASFRPIGSISAKKGPHHTDTLWRSAGLGTVWVLDFHFATIRDSAGVWSDWYFVVTEDGGVFGGPYDPSDDGPPAVLDLNWNIPQRRWLPTPDGLGPPTALPGTVAITYALTHRYMPDWSGKLQTELLVSLAQRSGTHGGRVLRGAPALSGGVFATKAGGFEPSASPPQRLTFDDHTLTGLPDAFLVSMVTTAERKPKAGTHSASGTVFAAAIGSGVFVLPPGSTEWRKVGPFVTRIQDPLGNADDPWPVTKLDRDPTKPDQNPLLNIFHLALCGESPRVLYASINLLSATRLDFKGYSSSPDGLEVNLEDLFASHYAAGLYRLEWIEGDQSGKPVDVDEPVSWETLEGKLELKHIAGLGAAYDLASSGVGLAEASELNFPRAWRNITSISGTGAGHLSLTTRAVQGVHPEIAPLTFDGGVFVCKDAANAGGLKPKFELLFTHPWAAASAFLDQAGGERLFVALNVYGELEGDLSLRSVTLFTTALNAGDLLSQDKLKQENGENRNQYYFTDASPELPRWPIGVYELVGWKGSSSGVLSLGDSHFPPALSMPSDNTQSLSLVDVGENLDSVVQEWLRMEVSSNRLLVGGRGSGSFWRKIPVVEQSS